jgi:hypothetical protein
MSKLPKVFGTMIKSIELCAHSPRPPGWTPSPPSSAGHLVLPAKKDTMEGLGMPNPHDWNPADDDWNLPENWEEIIYKALKDRLDKYRSLKIFMDMSACVAAPAPTSATSSLAPATRKTCRCCGRSCSAPCTAATFTTGRQAAG